MNKNPAYLGTLFFLRYLKIPHNCNACYNNLNPFFKFNTTMFQVQALNSFEDNYIWLVGKKNTPEVIIVDPGDGEPVLDFVKKQALKPVAIFITHHHYDHTGGTQELSRQYNIPVYGPALEKIPCLTHPLKQDDVVYIKENDLTFKILDVPGHTRGHIAFYVEGALFCGDTLFTAGSGRLFEGTAAQMQQSMDLILALPDETQVYCELAFSDS